MVYQDLVALLTLASQARSQPRGVVCICLISQLLGSQDMLGSGQGPLQLLCSGSSL